MFIRLRLFALLFVLALTGCSTLQVRVDPRSERQQRREVQAILASDAAQTQPGRWLEQANQSGLDSSARLSALIESARAAFPKGVHPDPVKERVYNAALREIVSILVENQFSDLTLDPVGPVRTLVLETQGNEVLDPRLADSLIVASSVRIRGLLTRTEQEGLGVPMVAYFKKGSDALLGQPGVPLSGMAIPVTAVLTFEKNAAKLAFQRTLVSDSVSVRGKRVQLAADFSAPIAILLSNGRNRSIDVSAFLFTKQKIGTSGLYQFQVYDPNKIPVIFVHGLLSRPEAWTQVLNGLLADPQIRERYQFWFYMYPTGLPVWSSASILRSEMDRFHSVLDPKNRNPDMNKIVLVGHSMGGLISSLLVREGGEQLWRQFSDRSPTSLNFSPNARRQLLNLIYFSPRNDVSRVIFVATPHRGSRLALNPIAGFFSRLVQLPFNVLDQDRQELLGAIRDDMRDLFVAPANSVQFLRAESPLLLSILNLPLSERVTYHSIIGDRGRGNTPNSSDGVVPYWSSHLEGAASEKIVPSGHGANEHPQGVEEIRRILVENLKQKSF